MWCMELFIFIVGIFQLFRLYKTIGDRSPSWNGLLEKLTEVRMQRTLNSPILVNTQVFEEKEIVELIKESCFQGKPISKQCDLLSEQIAKSEEYRSSQSRFLGALAFRVATVLGMSFLARLYLILTFELSLANGVNLLCLVSSFVMACIFFLGLARYYPKYWFQKEGKEWSRALFIGEVNATAPIYKSWQYLEDQERATGISLAHTKHVLLQTWARTKELEGKRHLQTFEDFIPLAEFVCLGSSTGLLLIAPITKVLMGS